MKIAVINPNNNQIIATGEHKKLYPFVSFPISGPPKKWMIENNVLEVQNERPKGPNTKLVEVEPYIDSATGNCYSVQLQTLSSADIAAEREEKIVNQKLARNTALEDSDWTQLTDAPLTSSKKTEWATYRQSLRDLPEHSDWPDVDLPNVPD